MEELKNTRNQKDHTPKPLATAGNRTDRSPPSPPAKGAAAATAPPHPIHLPAQTDDAPSSTQAPPSQGRTRPQTLRPAPGPPGGVSYAAMVATPPPREAKGWVLVEKK